MYVQYVCMCVCMHLEGWQTSIVADEEVHGDVLTVEVVVHPLPDLSRHLICVQVVIELGSGDKGQHNIILSICALL